MAVSVKRIRVAAVQSSSVNGATDRNLDNCAAWVKKAAARGAELVLCPELLAAGYVYEESIWGAAELRGGMTEAWLQQMAADHRIFIGATYLEAAGEHFYNTFALVGPDGVAGRVKKRSLPFFEGWFFTTCEAPKIIESPLGLVAVGICNDNQTAAFMRDVVDHRPDLILMPHSAPTPRAVTPRLPGLEGVFRGSYERQLKKVAKRYAKAFGVPVVMANKGSDEIVHSQVPHSPHVPVWPTAALSWTFDGHSTIVDHRGKTLGYLRGGEGVAVHDVVLDPSSKRADAEPKGYWSFPPRLGSRAAGSVLLHLDKLGRQAYRDNPRRRHAALSHTAAPKGANGTSISSAESAE